MLPPFITVVPPAFVVTVLVLTVFVKVVVPVLFKVRSRVAPEIAAKVNAPVPLLNVTLAPNVAVPV